MEGNTTNLIRYIFTKKKKTCSGGIDERQFNERAVLFSPSPTRRLAFDLTSAYVVYGNIFILHYVILRYIILYYIILHYIILHYIY